MSESQAVCSQPVCPSLAPIVCTESPKVAPCNVRLADPVAALFACRSTLSIPASTEKPAVTLPALDAEVSTKLRLLNEPDGPLQLTDVSDAHTVCSHAVAPSLKLALYVSRPTLPPNTVTLIDPLAPALLRLSILNVPALMENALDALPTLRPTVNIAFRLPNTPCAPWHRIVVSESQRVRSQVVDPIRTNPESVCRPIPTPCIVTLIDPDEATFRRLTTLLKGMDSDSPWLRLPTFPAELTTNVRLLNPARLAPHCTDVSDCQAVLSQDDRPMLLDVV